MSCPPCTENLCAHIYDSTTQLFWVNMPGVTRADGDDRQVCNFIFADTKLILFCPRSMWQFAYVEVKRSPLYGFAYLSCSRASDENRTYQSITHTDARPMINMPLLDWWLSQHQYAASVFVQCAQMRYSDSTNRRFNAGHAALCTQSTWYERTRSVTVYVLPTSLRLSVGILLCTRNCKGL